MSGEACAAVALVAAREPEPAVLLIRRAANPADPWSGHWSFPGGHREDGDEDLLETALRELAEECGVRLTREHVVGELPVADAGRRLGRVVRVTPFVFAVQSPVPVTLDRREAEEGLWTPLSLLRDPARHGVMPVPGMPDQERFPAIELNGVPLWGFTYRVLCHWLGI